MPNLLHRHKDTRLRVAEVIDALNMGGAARVVYNLVRNMDKSKFDVTIVCFSHAKEGENALEKALIAEGYRVVFLYEGRGFRRVRFMHLYLTLMRLAPDVIHAHQIGITAASYGSSRKIKTIFTVHTSPEGTETVSLKGKSLEVFHRYLHTGSVKIAAISQYNKELCKEHWHLTDDDVFAVNNGIDIKHFMRVEHEGVAFINVSRQDANKNQALIVRSFARVAAAMPDAKLRLYLVGDGKENAHLRDMVQAAGLSGRVTFTGYVADPAPYIAQSDVYVSSSNREGLSLSAIEGMAAGLPVIATDAGGVRELAGKNGYLVPCGDEVKMAEAMTEMAANHAERIRKGELSKKMAQSWSVETMVEGYESLFERFARR